jgi:hypothetical protein
VAEGEGIEEVQVRMAPFQGAYRIVIFAVSVSAFAGVILKGQKEDA